MNWLIDNLQIIATLGSAAAVYVALKNVAKKETTDIRNDIQEIRSDIKEIRSDIKDLNVRLQSLDSRVARIEGQLNPPPYHWEPQVFSKDKETK